MPPIDKAATLRRHAAVDSRAPLFAVEHAGRALQSSIAGSKHVEPFKPKIRNISAVQRPMPGHSESAWITVSSSCATISSNTSTSLAYARRQRRDVAAFGLRQAGGMQLFGRKLQKSFWRKRRRDHSRQPLFDRRGGLGRKLLADDRIGRACETAHIRAPPAGNGHARRSTVS